MDGAVQGTAASRGARAIGTLLGLTFLAITLMPSGLPLWTADDGIPAVLAVTVILAAPPVAILARRLTALRRSARRPWERRILAVLQGGWAGCSAVMAFDINMFATGWHQGYAVGLLAACAAGLVLWAAWAAEDRMSRPIRTEDPR